MVAEEERLVRNYERVRVCERGEERSDEAEGAASVTQIARAYCVVALLLLPECRSVLYGRTSEYEFLPWLSRCQITLPWALRPSLLVQSHLRRFAPPRLAAKMYKIGLAEERDPGKMDLVTKHAAIQQ